MASCEDLLEIPIRDSEKTKTSLIDFAHFCHHSIDALLVNLITFSQMLMEMSLKIDIVVKDYFQNQAFRNISTKNVTTTVSSQFCFITFEVSVLLFDDCTSAPPPSRPKKVSNNLLLKTHTINKLKNKIKRKTFGKKRTFEKKSFSGLIYP